jgi:hypothetical protein
MAAEPKSNADFRRRLGAIPRSSWLGKRVIPVRPGASICRPKPFRGAICSQPSFPAFRQRRHSTLPTPAFRPWGRATTPCCTAIRPPPFHAAAATLGEPAHSVCAGQSSFRWPIRQPSCPAIFLRV